VNRFFQRSEFACRCGCGYDTVDAELLKRLTIIRQRFGPVTINSGCRCATHNEREGGSPKSQHLLGRAADIKVTGVTPREIYEFYDEAFPTGGAHAYETFTHVDTRNHRARW
jgi:uncharacterized protein YcbK (DUF882 family)